MPIYEFTCGKCKAEFEELCSIAEAEAGEVECPECGAKKAEKRVSTFASTGGGDGFSGGGGGGCGSAGFG